MLAKEAKRLEGKALAAKIQEQIRSDVEAFKKKGLETPRLLILQTSHDPSAAWYIGQQKKLAEKLGIEHESLLPENLSTQDQLLQQVDSYSRGEGAKKVHGIFISLPLPQGFDVGEVMLHFDVKKDVEGVHPFSLGLIVLRYGKLIPSTAFAAFQLIESTGVALRGLRATIIGQSAIVGRPLQLLLGEKRVTTTVCNTGTSLETMEKMSRESDIVVACAGNPGLVKGSWIKPGAIVIDIGTTEVDGKLKGDVDFEEAKKNAGFITPVPGGVGPLTVTMLMQNLITAYKWQKKHMRLTPQTIYDKKAKGEKITALTAYDFPIAKILDTAGIDIVLVGDSLGMVLLGYENTAQVGMPEMLQHVQAVGRAVKESLVVADMPFGSYESEKTAVLNASLFLRNPGADAVKVEGGKRIQDQVKALMDAGVKVMGHIGMTPQISDLLGGYRVQGKNKEEAEKIEEDALLLDRLGVFSIVLECIPAQLAQKITRNVKCPTIGIGAGPETDGQILVLHDMLGFESKVRPKFVRKYADIPAQIRAAVENYKKDVIAGDYPNEKESY